MKPAFPVIILMVLAFACASGSRVIDEEGIARIEEELDRTTCTARMDSLCFEIQGLMYHSRNSGETIPVVQLLPESLPVCPSSGIEYTITETDRTVTVTCPSGHGSQTVEK